MSIQLRKLSRALATIALAGSSISAQAAPQYTVTALGQLPGGYSLDAYALNDSGSVTGFGGTPAGNFAFLRDNGAPINLGLLPGALNSGGHDINNQGVIVGSSSGSAFTWQAGQMSALQGLPGATYNSAYAINDKGDIVGDSGGTAAIWRQGMVTALPGLRESSGASAYDINTQGTVVGVNRVATWYQQPVTWTEGQITQLPTGAYQYGNALSINDSGSIVGSVELGGNLDQAARWDQGELTLLNQLEGFVSSRTYGINGAGLVVGTSFGWIDDTYGSTATLWEGTQAVALQDLLINGEGWQLWQAQDINSAGQIVGWGMLNGSSQSFLLSPVPESATWAYMAIGMIALTALGRRQRRA
jgi:uncharacterized membrane protein